MGLSIYVENTPGAGPRIALFLATVFLLASQSVSTFALAEPVAVKPSLVAEQPTNSDEIQACCDLLRGYEFLTKRFATTESHGKAVDETAFKAAEQQMKQEIASRNHLTVAQLEQIFTTRTAANKAHVGTSFPWSFVFLFLANIPAYLLIGRIIFGSWGGFWSTWSDSISSISMWPDVVDHYWANAKLLMFFVWALAVLAAEYCAIQQFFL